MLLVTQTNHDRVWEGIQEGILGGRHSGVNEDLGYQLWLREAPQ